MNEALFFLHLLLVFAFGCIALRLGKTALATWVAIQAVLANLFVIKQIFFFGFQVTSADVFAIGSVLGLNLLQEYFGKESAIQALWGAFFSMLFFAAMARVHLFYTPSSADTTQDAFHCILSSTPRLFAASVIVFFITQQLDIRIFQLLKQKMALMPFPWRSAISTTLSQFSDTVLFSLFGLWGLVASLGDVILVSFLIKLILISCMTPLLSLIKRWIPAKT